MSFHRPIVGELVAGLECKLPLLQGAGGAAPGRQDHRRWPGPKAPWVAKHRGVRRRASPSEAVTNLWIYLEALRFGWRRFGNGKMRKNVQLTPRFSRSSNKKKLSALFLSGLRVRWRIYYR